MRALQGCVLCAILMKSSGFLGISMSDLNSQFDCICLRSLDFIGVLSFYLWSVCFHNISLGCNAPLIHLFSLVLYYCLSL